VWGVVTTVDPSPVPWSYRAQLQLRWGQIFCTACKTYTNPGKELASFAIRVMFTDMLLPLPFCDHQNSSWQTCTYLGALEQFLTITVCTGSPIDVGTSTHGYPSARVANDRAPLTSSRSELLHRPVFKQRHGLYNVVYNARHWITT
jgi:hypothetical protein